MNTPVASLIISVYNNTLYLQSVLDSLRFQTDKRFEVIISEDAEHEEMKTFIKEYNYEGELYHISQPDIGWRKNRALNRAAVFAHTDYLIFIDGDCVLHPRFIEFHLKLAEEKAILAGKRIKLNHESTEWLLSKKENLLLFQKYLLRNYRRMRKDGALFMEEGFFFNPDSILGFIPKLRSMYHLKGCNMSFSKKALYDINGFDEDYIRPAIGEDIDLTWRFQRAGCKLKSLRNLAVQYHLYHHENWTNQDDNIAMMRQKQEKDMYVCRNGLKKINQINDIGL